MFQNGNVKLNMHLFAIGNFSIKKLTKSDLPVHYNN